MTSTCILLAFYDQNWNLSTRKTIQYLPLCIHRIQNKATSAVWHPWLLGWGLSPVVLGKGLVLCPPESWIWVSLSPSLDLFTQFPNHLSPADWSTSGIPTSLPAQVFLSSFDVNWKSHRQTPICVMGLVVQGTR